jgi:hypothetical protein
MKFKAHHHARWISAILAATLTACGGGGGGGAEPATDTDGQTGTVEVASPAQLDPAEYMGTWIIDTTECRSGFAYGDYSYRFESLALTNQDATLTQIAYTDAACTMKAGKLVETFQAQWSAVAADVVGRTNVAKLQLVYRGMNLGHDGGTGISLSKFPDGASLRSLGGMKLLLDVDGGKLLSSPEAPVDADGYRALLNPVAFATRQPAP